MIIIGITGTIGAGKGTIVDYLVSHYNFKHYSVRGFIIEEIERRNLPVNRDSMVTVANDLRTNNSPSYLIDKLYEKAVANGQNCIIESIRTPGEVLSLKRKNNFVLLAVDADPKTRYHRIIERASETDNVSFETFVENEKREFNTTDPNKQNLKKCIEMADYHIKNNGSIEDLHKEIEKIIEKL
ncbi:MAG: AAA family ATPase [Bacteroidales bacterium]|jgi:dephospho-CoA kinase|nr:AAA family ATPase [Bacteroidales bacterium]